MIDELEGSALMARALGEHIFPRYVELKRKEWDEYRVQVTEWEKEKYLARCSGLAGPRRTDTCTERAKVG